MSADIEYSGDTENSSAKLIIVTYNSSGTLINLKVDNINGDRVLSENDYKLTSGEKIKLYIWNGFDSIKPLSKAVQIIK